MDEQEEIKLSEEELESIRRMRDFRRMVSIIVALLVLLAALLLGLTSGKREPAKGHTAKPAVLHTPENLAIPPALCGNTTTGRHRGSAC